MLTCPGGDSAVNVNHKVTKHLVCTFYLFRFDFIYVFTLCPKIFHTSWMRCRECLTLFSDSETSFSPSRCLTWAPDAHKVWLFASQFRALHCVTNGGMTRAAKSALNTGCVSDYLQYLCPFSSSSVCSPAALKTKLSFLFKAGRNGILLEIVRWICLWFQSGLWMAGDSHENPSFALFTNGWWLTVYLCNCGSRPLIREVTRSRAIFQISQNNEQHVLGRQLPAFDEAVNGVVNGEYDGGSQVSWGGRSESCQAHWLVAALGVLSRGKEACLF